MPRVYKRKPKTPSVAVDEGLSIMKAPKVYYPFYMLKVGDSFLVEDKPYRLVYQSVWHTNKRSKTGARFRCAIDQSVHDATRVERIK